MSCIFLHPDSSFLEQCFPTFALSLFRLLLSSSSSFSCSIFPWSPFYPLDPIWASFFKHPIFNVCFLRMKMFPYYGYPVQILTVIQKVLPRCILEVYSRRCFCCHLLLSKCEYMCVCVCVSVWERGGRAENNLRYYCKEPFTLFFEAGLICPELAKASLVVQMSLGRICLHIHSGITAMRSVGAGGRTQV